MMKKLFVMGLALSLCMLGLFTSLAQASEPRELCEKGTVLPDPGRHSLHSSVFGRLIDARNRLAMGLAMVQEEQPVVRQRWCKMALWAMTTPAAGRPGMFCPIRKELDTILKNAFH